MMNINRLNPAISTLWDEVDQLFNRTLFPAVRAASPGRFLVSEGEEGWTLRADLPGFAKDDVEVGVENGFLKVTAAERDDNPGFVGAFEERLRLSPKVDTGRIAARLENGVLEVDLPRRKEEEKPNFRIEVN